MRDARGAAERLERELEELIVRLRALAGEIRRTPGELGATGSGAVADGRLAGNEADAVPPAPLGDRPRPAPSPGRPELGAPPAPIDDLHRLGRELQQRLQRLRRAMKH